MADLLLEIGLEEIPARMIASAESELARRVRELLERERLIEVEGEAAVRSYSTPRRLAVVVEGVSAAQADRVEQMTGPAWAIAFKDGTPGPAAHAFAKKAGVAVEALERITTPKGDYVGALVKHVGLSAAEVLAAELPKQIAAIFWAKNMYWRADKPERYVRPVKWLLALLDHAILPVEFAGVHAANLTYGHRVLHGRAAVTVNHPREYADALRAAHVLADVAVRRQCIRKALDHATRTVTDARWREDEPLVETVTHLTEWPSVVLGSFEPGYLSLPEEVLVTVMRDHQKYFAVEDKSGKLAPYFLAVLNTEADEAGLDVIRHGNKRVLRARFNDARFFWDFDQKIPLDDRVELLKSVTFQKDLGDYYVKCERTAAIAGRLSEIANNRGVQVDTASLMMAARLAKTDLTSELVKEFTELQGIVGGLYARAQGCSEGVAQAIYWQYQPASSTDPIPRTVEGQLLGLADRIGTVVDMFVQGFAPTGSKDPYALRRSANAIVMILAQSDLRLQLDEVIHAAVTDAKAGEQEDRLQTITSFFAERVSFYLRDVSRMPYDVVAAVLASRAGGSVADQEARARALSLVRDSEDFLAISTAFKRSKNILRQAAEKGMAADQTTVLPEVLVDPFERSLWHAAQQIGPQVEQLRQQRDYPHALAQIATLRPHVDLFFEKVMVMVDDPAVRSNRLALLAIIVGEFSRIADFSEIVVPGA